MFSAPKVSIPPPAPVEAPAAPPVFGTQSPGVKPSARVAQSTFLGAIGTNPTDTGNKTLLGA